MEEDHTFFFLIFEAKCNALIKLILLSFWKERPLKWNQSFDECFSIFVSSERKNQLNYKIFKNI